MPDEVAPRGHSAPTSRRVDNTTETELSSSASGPFAWRLAYQRSLDGRLAQSVGQDALSLRVSGDRFVFALCDGVSNSFYGDIAAGVLSEALVDWLWTKDPRLQDELALQSDLEGHLREVARRAQTLVDQAVLPSSLSPIVREALDGKRAYGSQSTLVGAQVTLGSNGAPQALLVRLGDSRIRMWDGGLETPDVAGAPTGGEVWSTARGVVGGKVTVTVTIPTQGAGLRVAAYSDGLDVLDEGPWPRSDRAIKAALELAADRIASDDASFLEVAVREQLVPVVRPPLLAPADLTAGWVGDVLVASWPPVDSATSYQVQRRDVSQVTKTTVESGCSLGALPRRPYRLRVRAMDGAEPGHWSPDIGLTFKPEPEALLPRATNGLVARRVGGYAPLAGVAAVLVAMVASFALLAGNAIPPADPRQSPQPSQIAPEATIRPTAPAASGPMPSAQAPGPTHGPAPTPSGPRNLPPRGVPTPI
jgi:hypothetical protein